MAGYLRSWWEFAYRVGWSGDPDVSPGLRGVHAWSLAVDAVRYAGLHGRGDPAFTGPPAAVLRGLGITDLRSARGPAVYWRARFQWAPPCAVPSSFRYSCDRVRVRDLYRGFQTVVQAGHHHRLAGRRFVDRDAPVVIGRLRHALAALRIVRGATVTDRLERNLVDFAAALGGEGRPGPDGLRIVWPSGGGLGLWWPLWNR